MMLCTHFARQQFKIVQLMAGHPALATASAWFGRHAKKTLGWLR